MDIQHHMKNQTIFTRTCGGYWVLKRVGDFRWGQVILVDVLSDNHYLGPQTHEEMAEMLTKEGFMAVDHLKVDVVERKKGGFTPRELPWREMCYVLVWVIVILFFVVVGVLIKG